jgi:hypothetical protein
MHMQVPSRPTWLVDVFARLLGPWYLTLAIERHTRLWAAALLLAAVSGVVGVSAIAFIGTDEGSAGVHAFSWAFCGVLYICVFLGLPVFDRLIVGLLWRQVMRGADARMLLPPRPLVHMVATAAGWLLG